MVTTIYITRHGYRSNWLKDVPVPDPPTGISADPVLADHGVEQAEQLGAHLSGIEPRIQRIYSSPFYRCLQTVQPAAKLLALEIWPETGANEWFAKDRSSHPAPASAKTLKQFFPEVKEDYEPLVPPSTDGETEEELHQRAIVAMEKLVGELQHEPEIKTILICTHAATKIALGRALTGDPNLDIRTGVCSLDKYELIKDKTGMPGDWKIVTNGETSYLKDGEEMHWSFENPYAPGSTEDIRAREAAAQKTTSHSQSASTSASTQKEENISVYIPIDMEMAPQTFNSVSNSAMQIIDFESERPIFKIGDAAYEGEFQSMVGTEVYTDTEGKEFGLSRDGIKAYPVNLKDVNNEESSNWKRINAFQQKLDEITKQRLEQAGNQ